MDMRFEHVTTEGALASLIERLNAKGEPVVLDLETTGLDRFKDTIISAQLCVAGETTAHYIEGNLVDALIHLSCPLVLHNFKFDFAFLFQRGTDLRKRTLDVRAGWAVRDTMLMHHLADETAEHSLDACVKARWNDDYKERFWAAHKSFQEAPEAERIDYACRDVVYTGLLYGHILSDLQQQNVPEELVEHVHKLALALYDTEVLGVRVDLDYLVKTGDALTARISGYKDVLRATAPLAVEQVELDMWLGELDKRKSPKGKAGVKRPSFNWDSGKQLQQLIYGELNIPPIVSKSKSTGETRPTLDDAALEQLHDKHPLIETLRAYRADQKVFGSFIEGTLTRHVGGRIYPSFSVNGTVTGRISSSNPNLQQLPRDGGVRGIYVADEGHLLVSCDYAMLEVVVAAHYSKDPALLKIIYDGASKHDITAEALGIPRQLAKTVNFACQYQCSHYKVASILGVSEKEGLYAWQKYWETYAGEKAVIDECKGKVDRGEPIVNLFGRRRRFPRVFAAKWEREAAYRQAYSSLVQGSGADITHLAFYRASDAFRRNRLGRALFEVHDEILVSAESARAEEAAVLLQNTMLEAGRVLSVPLGVDCSPPLERWQKG